MNPEHTAGAVPPRAGLTTVRLALRSAWFHRRANLGVLLTMATACAILTGALLVGDSVRHTLRTMALQRIGQTDLALHAADRFFAAGLGERLAADLPARVAPVLQLPAVVLRPAAGGRPPSRLSRGQAIGVDNRFWAFAPAPARGLEDGTCALGAAAARQLGARVGDDISIRIEPPGLLPRDAPLARAGDRTRRTTCRLARIVPDAEFGRFSLQPAQLPPPNVFLPLAALQALANLPGRANTLLAAARPGAEPVDASRAAQVLARCWRLDDVGIQLRDRSDGGPILTSERVFVDPPVGDAALRGPGTVGTLAYLVNSIATPDGSRMTPYSFMTAMTPSTDRAAGVVPAGMADDEILINAWLANTLAVRTGASVVVRYFTLTPANAFAETQRVFRVYGIVPMEALADERARMPAFPGLTDVEQCADWNIGMPMDETLLKDAANEAYWEAWRETPKAFVTLAAGQAMWGNRFGRLTGVRFPAGGPAAAEHASVLAAAVPPDTLGLGIRPVRAEALAAARPTVDFGGLFLGMSLFLIAAALLLTGLVFYSAWRRRASDIGVLLALGFRRAQVRNVVMAEAACVALPGALVGAGLGMVYTQALIRGLQTYWSDAVGGSAILFQASAGSLAGGAAAGGGAALAVAASVTRRLLRRTPLQLMADTPAAEGTAARGRAGRRTGWSALTAGILAAGAVAGGSVAPDWAVPSFFAAGAMLLTAALAAGMWFLLRPRRGGDAGGLTLDTVARINLTRHPARSGTAMAVLACGVFMVLAVAASREDVTRHADRRNAGTGGFALIGEATLPLHERLDTPAGWSRAFPGSEAATRPGIVSIKVRDLADASCLNLNRVAAPRLLGVPASRLRDIGAFTSTSAAVWELLDRPLPDGSVPGLAGDLNTAQWGLRKRADPVRGDTLAYVDEWGRPFKVRLVGALPVRVGILQGSVLIPDWAFTERFPSEAGYRLMLIDGAPGEAARWRTELVRRFEREGLDMIPATDRLRDLGRVENAYLTMFLALGGLGLVLGSVGLGLVLAWNVADRRAELAMMRAMGFTGGAVRRLVAREHVALLAAGLAGGMVAAGVAIWPRMKAASSEVPWLGTGAVVLLIAAVGWLATTLAVRRVLRGSLLPALRND